MAKNVKTEEIKKEYRIILNLLWNGITVGAGEDVPKDLLKNKEALQDFISKGNIAEVDAVTNENIDILHKTADGKLILSDAEILNLRPTPKTLNFLKANKICRDSLKKLKANYDKMTTKYGVPNNFFVSEIYKILDDELKAGD
jgi:hypothetical protein